MSEFSDAIAEGLDAVACVAGVNATYHRGSDWVALTVVPGKTDFLIEDANGVVTKLRSRDYLFKAEKLVLNGTTVTPKKGDLIKEKIGNQIHTYELLRADGGEQVWRYSDHGRSRIRVHTMLKGVALA